MQAIKWPHNYLTNDVEPKYLAQELLELLTRSQRAVRMIPIPVSSREAR